MIGNEIGGVLLSSKAALKCRVNGIMRGVLRIIVIVGGNISRSH